MIKVLCSQFYSYQILLHNLALAVNKSPAVILFYRLRSKQILYTSSMLWYCQKYLPEIWRFDPYLTFKLWISWLTLKVNISSPIKRKKNCGNVSMMTMTTAMMMMAINSAEHFPKATLGSFLQLTAFLSQIWYEIQLLKKSALSWFRETQCERMVTKIFVIMKINKEALNLSLAENWQLKQTW